MSVLTALAEWPDRVRKIFVDTEMNEHGIFGIRCFKNGYQQQIVVDSHIPTIDGLPAFTSSNENELWAIILEKAWAKLHGSYLRIIGGMCHETFRDLTGAPSYEYDAKRDDVWDIIKASNEANYMLTAGIHATDEEHREKFEHYGLMVEHAYCVIGCAEVVDSNGETAWIIKIRNPWGNREWKGDWSDESELWTEEAKE